jgi:hypothetical protein
MRRWICQREPHINANSTMCLLVELILCASRRFVIDAFIYAKREASNSQKDRIGSPCSLMSMDSRKISSLLRVFFHIAAVATSVCAWTTRHPVNVKMTRRTGSSYASKISHYHLKQQTRRLSSTLLRTQCSTQPLSDDGGSLIGTSQVLQKLLRPFETCDVDRMSGTDLAYIGDVVYELFVRSRTVWPPKRTADLQQQAVALVRGTYNERTILGLHGLPMISSFLTLFTALL